jgi:DNA-binding MarR family transcriptional regulator
MKDAHRSLLLSMGMTARMLRAAFEQYVGIGETRLRLLAHLYAEHEVSQADLQRRLRIDGAAITRQVKQLESEGILARRPDPSDNRFTLVNLTPAGVELVLGMAAKGQEFERRVLQDMAPEDIACATRILTQLRENLTRMGAGGQCDGAAEAEPEDQS